MHERQVDGHIGAIALQKVRRYSNVVDVSASMILQELKGATYLVQACLGRLKCRTEVGWSHMRQAKKRLTTVVLVCTHTT